jgi:hypothetical protein
VRKEIKMRRILALGVMLTVVMMFSGAALAGDFGSCDSRAHVNQAQTDKATTVKPVAKEATPKIEADQLVLVQTVKPSKPAGEKN